jgi:hypothetical protein
MLSDRAPYVGSSPFERTDADRFFGRDLEIDELTSIILAHNFVLVYAASGAGKTSLLNAGVIPKLVEEGLTVFPRCRVGLTIPTDVELAPGSNPYVFNLLCSLSPETPASALASTQLADRLRELPATGAGRVLLIDQAEELFTFMPADWQRHQTAFFEGLRDLLRDATDLRVVLATREDYLARFDEFRHYFADGMRVRMHVKPLAREAARRAVEDPLGFTSRRFDEGVADQLVDDLSKTKIVARTQVREAIGPYVEPVQLQIVCAALWDRLPTNVNLITAEHVQQFGDVEETLERFYAETVEACATTMGLDKEQLAKWFGQDLITPADTRGQVFKGELETRGLRNEAVEFFESRHLLHADDRASGRWYELAHDRLVRPIRAINERWNNEFKAARSRRAFRDYVRRLALSAGLIIAGIVVLITAYLVPWLRERAKDRAFTTDRISGLRSNCKDREAQLSPREAADCTLMTVRVFDAVTDYYASEQQYGDLAHELEHARDLIPPDYGQPSSDEEPNESREGAVVIRYDLSLGLDKERVKREWRQRAAVIARHWGIPVVPELSVIDSGTGLGPNEIEIVTNPLSCDTRRRTEMHSRFEVPEASDAVFVPLKELAGHPIANEFFQAGRDLTWKQTASPSGMLEIVPAWTQPIWHVANLDAWGREGFVARSVADTLLDHPELMLGCDALTALLQHAALAAPDTVNEAIRSRGLESLRMDLIEIVRGRKRPLTNPSFLFDRLADYPGERAAFAAAQAMTDGPGSGVDSASPITGPTVATLAIGVEPASAVDVVVTVNGEPLNEADEFALESRDSGKSCSVHVEVRARGFEDLMDDVELHVGDNLKTYVLGKKGSPHLPAPKPSRNGVEDLPVNVCHVVQRLTAGWGPSELERVLVANQDCRAHPIVVTAAPALALADRTGSPSEGTSKYVSDVRDHVYRRYGILTPDVAFRATPTKESSGLQVQVLDREPTRLSASQVGSVFAEIERLTSQQRVWLVTAETVTAAISTLPEAARTWFDRTYSITDLKRITRAVVADDSVDPDNTSGTLRELPWLLKSLVFWSIAEPHPSPLTLGHDLRRTQHARLEPSGDSTPSAARESVQLGLQALDQEDVDSASKAFRAAISSDPAAAVNAFLTSYPAAARRAEQLKRACSPQTNVLEDQAALYDIEDLVADNKAGLDDVSRHQLELCLALVYKKAGRNQNAQVTLDQLVQQGAGSSWTDDEADFLVIEWWQSHAKDVSEPLGVGPSGGTLHQGIASLMTRVLTSPGEWKAFAQAVKAQPAGWVRDLVGEVALQLPGDSDFTKFNMAYWLNGFGQVDAIRAQKIVEARWPDDERWFADYLQISIAMHLAHYLPRNEAGKALDGLVKPTKELGSRATTDEARADAKDLLASIYLAEGASDDLVRAPPSPESQFIASMRDGDTARAGKIAAQMAESQPSDVSTRWINALFSLLTSRSDFEAMASAFMFSDDDPNPYVDYVRVLLYWRLFENNRGEDAKRMIKERMLQIAPASWPQRLEQRDTMVWREMLVALFAGKIDKSVIFNPLRDADSFHASKLDATELSLDDMRTEAYFYTALWEDTVGDLQSRATRRREDLQHVVELGDTEEVEYGLAKFLMATK